MCYNLWKNKTVKRDRKLVSTYNLLTRFGILSIAHKTWLILLFLAPNRICLDFVTKNIAIQNHKQINSKCSKNVFFIYIWNRSNTTWHDVSTGCMLATKMWRITRKRLTFNLSIDLCPFNLDSAWSFLTETKLIIDTKIKTELVMPDAWLIYERPTSDIGITHRWLIFKQQQYLTSGRNQKKKKLYNKKKNSEW